MRLKGRIEIRRHESPRWRGYAFGFGSTICLAKRAGASSSPNKTAPRWLPGAITWSGRNIGLMAAGVFKTAVVSAD